MADIPSTPVDGKLRITFVETLTNPAAPTVAELNGGLDVSCYLTGDGWNASINEGTISDPRLCDTATYEQPGRVSKGLSTTYIENPVVGDNDMAEALVPGTTGYFVERRGIAYATAFAAAQKVTTWPVTAGAKLHVAEQEGVFRITQKQFVTGPVREDVAVAA